MGLLISLQACISIFVYFCYLFFSYLFALHIFISSLISVTLPILEIYVFLISCLTLVGQSWKKYHIFSCSPFPESI